MSIFSRRPEAELDDESAPNEADEPREGTEPGQETERVGRCLECKTSLEGYRADAIYCSDAHRKAYTRRQDKITERKRSYLSDHPELSEADLDSALAEARKIMGDGSEGHSRAGHQGDDSSSTREAADPPRWEDIRSDYLPMIDGRGHAFNDYMKYQEAEEAIWARYDAKTAPYRDTQRRNKGVVLPQIRAAEIQRDRELETLHRAHERAESTARAARNRPVQVMSAMEMQTEQAALAAFGAQLPGRRVRSMAGPQGYQGRSTESLINWG